MENKQKPRGYWSNIYNIFLEIDKIMRKHDLKTVPSSNWLKDHDYGSVDYAITTYVGYRDFRKFHDERLKTPYGRWNDLEYAKERARRFMEKHKLDNLPGFSYMRKHNAEGLATAIIRYHGGFRRFREKMGLAQIKVERGCWSSLEYRLKVATEAMKKGNYLTLPSETKLKKLGYAYLPKAIRIYDGGMGNFREKLEQLTEHLYEDKEHTISITREVLRTHNIPNLPEPQILTELGYPRLAEAIELRYGGREEFAKMIA